MVVLWYFLALYILFLNEKRKNIKVITVINNKVCKHWTKNIISFFIINLLFAVWVQCISQSPSISSLYLNSLSFAIVVISNEVINFPLPVYIFVIIFGAKNFDSVFLPCFIFFLPLEGPIPILRRNHINSNIFICNHFT